MASPARSKILLLPAAFLLAGLAACARTEMPPPREFQPLPEERQPGPVVIKAPPPAPTPQELYRQSRRKNWEEGVKSIRLLEPEHFPEAPPELREALGQLGCRIPQTLFTYSGYFEPDWPVQDNLVPGHFKSNLEIHWAVLCSRSGRTSLLLFDSRGENMETLEGPRENSGLLIEGMREDALPDFSWSIDVTDQKGVIAEFDEYGDDDDQRPPAIQYEALSSSHGEYSSTIYYWHRCKWVPISPPGC